MEDDVDDRDKYQDNEADTDADDDDDDHDDGDHDGDDHDDAVSGSSQWQSWTYRLHHVAIICIILMASSTLFEIYLFDGL